MKQIKRMSTAILAMLLVLACLFGTVGCYAVSTTPQETTGNNGNGGNTQPPNGNNGNNTNPTPDGKVNYTVNVKTVGGLALSGLKVFVYEYDTATGELGDLKNYGTTDANGVAQIKLAPNGN